MVLAALNYKKIKIMYNDIYDLQKMLMESKTKQQIMQVQNSMKQAEEKNIKQKYGLCSRSLIEEIDKIKDGFLKNVQQLDKDTQPEIFKKVFLHTAYENIFNKCKAQSAYLKQMQDAISKSPSLVMADNHYNQLKVQHQEFKYALINDTKQCK